MTGAPSAGGAVRAAGNDAHRMHVGDLPSENASTAGKSGPDPWIVLSLPPPFSANAAFDYVSKGCRKKTAEYVAWRREAAWALKAQRAPRLIGPIEIEIEIPRTSRLDADNSVKPALDALVDARVIEDDRHVRRLLVEKSGEPGRTTVRLRSVEGHKP